MFLPRCYGSVVSFTPTLTMPSTIYYNCSIHSGMKGLNALISLSCSGDLNGDLNVNASDSGIFANAFGATCTGCLAEMGGDGGGWNHLLGSCGSYGPWGTCEPAQCDLP